MTEEEAKINDWQLEAYWCDEGPNETHDYIPLAKLKTETAEHLTEIICKYCFHKILINDALKYRRIPEPDPLPEEHLIDVEASHTEL